MTLMVLGISHDTATVALREKVAIAPECMPEALQSLCQQDFIDEAVILSTCNRTEILASTNHCDESAMLHWLASYRGIHIDSLHSHYYSHYDDDALLHMMRVASGMDSMILGEPQILGQMKSAYAVAKQVGSLDNELNHVFQHTFSYAKKVRSQTAIGQNPVSVAFAAVNLSQRIFSDLSKSKALLIGAGETIDLVARHLYEKQIGGIIVANRTLTRAQELAKQYQAEAILLADLADRLPEVDIVISSTASQLPILGKGAVEKAIHKRKRRPIFMVDIAVPRDIEPEVSRLRDVYLYTVDDLRDIIDENKKARLNEVAKADIILSEGVQSWHTNKRLDNLAPVLKNYREQSDFIKEQLLDKALKQIASGADGQKVLADFARLLSNKLTHLPLLHLRHLGETGQWEAIEQFTQLLEHQKNETDK